MSEVIVRLAARGDGVTASGRYVAGAAPGDTVDAHGLVTRGPHRREPPCAHYPACGGCQLQHVDDAAYAQFLIDRVAGALLAQGLPPADIRAPHLSPPHARRRVALTAERTGKAVRLGFNAAKSTQLVDIQTCPVLDARIAALIAPLRALLAFAMPSRGRVRVRMTVCDQGVDLHVAGVSLTGWEQQERLLAFAADHALARMSLEDDGAAATIWEPEPATITLGGVAVPLPADAFLQATADAEAALVAGVIEALGDAAPVADLFCGLGTFALALDRAVHGAEGARDPAFALQGAARLARRPVTVEHRDLFRRPLSAAELGRFAGVVLDPPRAGAEQQAMQLAASPVPLIAYVSCNPATFARDLRLLSDGGYRLDWVRPVGQFRWSTHVELIAALRR